MKPLLYYLLIFALAWCMTSCSGPWHLQRAIKKGVHIDTTRTRTMDSATVKPIEASGEQDKDVDMDSLLQNCRDLLTAAQNEKASNQPENTGSFRGKSEGVLPAAKIITKIQRTVCPQEAIDSTYTGTLSIQGKDYALPLHVVINAKDGHLKWSVGLGKVVAPFVKEETTAVKISAGDSKWANTKQYFFGALIGAFLMFVFFIVARAAKWMV